MCLILHVSKSSQGVSCRNGRLFLHMSWGKDRQSGVTLTTHRCAVVTSRRLKTLTRHSRMAPWRDRASQFYSGCSLYGSNRGVGLCRIDGDAVSWLILISRKCHSILSVTLQSTQQLRRGKKCLGGRRISACTARNTGLLITYSCHVLRYHIQLSPVYKGLCRGQNG